MRLLFVLSESHSNGFPTQCTVHHLTAEHSAYVSIVSHAVPHCFYVLFVPSLSCLRQTLAFLAIYHASASLMNLRHLCVQRFPETNTKPIPLKPQLSEDDYIAVGFVKHGMQQCIVILSLRFTGNDCYSSISVYNTVQPTSYSCTDCLFVSFR